MAQILGIDIGGSSLKFGVVETTDGTIVGKTDSIPIESRATPARLIETIDEARRRRDWAGPIGIGYPGVVKNGCTLSAAHLDDSFLGRAWLTELRERFGPQTGLINDADAAGLAEVVFGAGSDTDRASVLVVTLGTGIGTAFFHDRKLFPNTEFGHMLIGQKEAEDLAAGAVKVEENLSWETYGARLSRFLTEMERLLSPDRIIIGGGISVNFERFRPFLGTDCETAAAQLGNDAGLIGAALAVERD
jgi:polyphosphate glucokinase